MSSPEPWPADDVSPYVHWWETIGNSGTLSREDIIHWHDDPPAAGGGEMQHNLRPYFGKGKAHVPIPSAVANPDGLFPGKLVPDNIAELVPPVPREAVFTVVVDEAIALGHPRFRNADGKTRIIAAWQQGATFDETQKDYMPFGHELYARDINALLRKYSVCNDLGRPYDETVFNRAARLDEPGQPHGVRALSRRHGHGTAVLDLAAGFDAACLSSAVLDLRPIIAVTLPSRKTIGMAGTFLEFYAIYAINRIVALTDAIWRAQHGTQGGFPIVVNLSYGQQAGPKDGKSPLETEIRRLKKKRPENAPLLFTMPAGNDNLMRCHARRDMHKKDPDFCESWRVQPEDHTSNFIEIWTKPIPEKLKIHPLKIRVRSPLNEAARQWRLAHGEFVEIAAGARIYCQRLERGDDKTREFRFRYVICVPPTADDARLVQIGRKAVAGLWDIHVTTTRKLGHVYMNVQVDQSAEPGGALSRRSYLDNKGYKKYLCDGRLRDTFRYPLHDPDDATSSNLERWPDCHVQRKGTINAIAVSSDVICVGSFRGSDGCPSSFSGTSYWGPHAPAKGKNVLDVAFPSDDSASHRGVLAAGTAAGSVARFRGTSFSTALATRYLVDRMCEMPAGTDRKHAVKLLLDSASQDVTSRRAGWGAAAENKIGFGRIAAPETGYPRAKAKVHQRVYP